MSTHNSAPSILKPANNLSPLLPLVPSSKNHGYVISPQSSPRNWGSDHGDGSDNSEGVIGGTQAHLSSTLPLKNLPLIPNTRLASTSVANSAVYSNNSSSRLNKFVRRLHDMLQAEKDSGIVEWRRGLLVLLSTGIFAKQILPKYFNTRNFKTFRRQLNYYGFVHVRSFSTTGASTTALWVNQMLAEQGSDDISSILMLKRVDNCEQEKTAQARRVRKEIALHTVEEDMGVHAKSLQINYLKAVARFPDTGEGIPKEIYAKMTKDRDASDESAAILLLLLAKN